ncbi:MAG: cobalamin ABC transporter substrate-binding protein [Aestuariivita sp.]|nr:cobalamin ABC transporter substrate-binding protein [Aestuariivita sp.]
MLAMSPTFVLPEQPKRVVSINLCTDQLALMLAKSGQLVSISKLSHDPDVSPLVEKALSLPSNGSGAEEVFLLKPDLVLAGTFTAPATLNLLRRLGIKVETFPPSEAIEDIPKRLLQMGKALGREKAAKQIIERFNNQLKELRTSIKKQRPRAALTYVNSFTSGDNTLVGDMLIYAGFDNAATQAGISSYGTLSLEELVMLEPEVVIQGRNYPGAARAEDNLNHPALVNLTNTDLITDLINRDWICDTPYILNAVKALQELRLSVEDGS